MRAQDIIAKKRDGGTLSAAEIGFFVEAYTRGGVPDYQAAALLMAIYLRGMDAQETADLTSAMAASGRTLDLAGVLPPGTATLDKHSTGGVGDKTSLVVVPILAAAGVAVCKMSGRGLGHTGGTLDKLESIPGFRVGLTPEEMTAQVARIGACLAGQTDDLAPADKKLYALRDATATVGSLPLIVGSILSKKLAGGAEAFLFDVKAGGGALMKTPDEARALAEALVLGARANGRRALAVLSDMSQPLGRTVGNALEVAEAVDLLTPGADADPRLTALCIRLAAEGLVLAGKADDLSSGELLAQRTLASGAAREKLREIIVAQGGDARVIDEPADVLPKAPVIRLVPAPAAGFIAGIDAEAVGHIVVALGGGRLRKEDTVDHAVGVIVRAAVGSAVSAGAPLAEVHARTDEDAGAAADRLLAAYRLTDSPLPPAALILGRVPD